MVVVGDGEAETGPLATSWHSNKFLNPAQDGAVLPILHLNGYKIANPTILARIDHEELESLLIGYGYEPYFVEGSDPKTMHQRMAQTLEEVLAEIRAIQHEARTNGVTTYPRWPMIVLRSPKGWTAPHDVDGHTRGGLLAGPPGAVQDPRQARAPPAPGGVDAGLPAGEALRRERDD